MTFALGICLARLARCESTSALRAMAIIAPLPAAPPEPLMNRSPGRSFLWSQRTRMAYSAFTSPKSPSRALSIPSIKESDAARFLAIVTIARSRWVFVRSVADTHATTSAVTTPIAKAATPGRTLFSPTPSNSKGASEAARPNGATNTW